MKSRPKYVVTLEKKGRGRGITIMRPWAVRTFKLQGQNLEYFDGDRLKGVVPTQNSVCQAVDRSLADNKDFPFVLDTGKEKLMLNAVNEETREKCILIFNRSAQSPDWELPVQERHQKSAKEAVVALMKNNVDEVRFKEEEAKLEKERQEKVTAAASAALEEELANKKLREAKEAEQRQREQQVSSCLSIFCSMLMRNDLRREKLWNY